MSDSSNHPAVDSISAYIDHELAPGELAEIEAHLDGCAECRATKASLASASDQIASLEQVQVTADEHRALRRSITESFGGRQSPWFAGTRWLLAGGVATLLVVSIGLATVLGGRSGDRSTETSRQAGALAFHSDKQIRRFVGSHPQVGPGLNRYRVGDEQSGAGSGSASETAAAARDGRLKNGGSDESAPMSGAAPAAGPDAGPQRSGESDQDRPAPPPLGLTSPQDDSTEAQLGDAHARVCLDKLRETQPHEMAGLLAEPATYKNRPAWLLAYAWTPSNDPGARLDRVRVWVITRGDCTTLNSTSLRSRVLHYSSFKPE